MGIVDCTGRGSPESVLWVDVDNVVHWSWPRYVTPVSVLRPSSLLQIYIYLSILYEHSRCNNLVWRPDQHFNHALCMWRCYIIHGGQERTTVQLWYWEHRGCKRYVIRLKLLVLNRIGAAGNCSGYLAHPLLRIPLWTPDATLHTSYVGCRMELSNPTRRKEWAAGCMEHHGYIWHKWWRIEDRGEEE